MKNILKISLLLSLSLTILFSLIGSDELSTQQMENIKGGAGYVQCGGTTACGANIDCVIKTDLWGNKSCTNGSIAGTKKNCVDGSHLACEYKGKMVDCYKLKVCEYDDSMGGTGICKTLREEQQKYPDCVNKTS